MGATAGGSVTADASSFPKRTPLILFWGLSTVLWSIFTPPDKTFVARVLLFQPGWIVRMLKQDGTWLQDLTLFLFVHAVYSYGSGAWRFPSMSDFHWLNFDDRTIRLYMQVFSLLGICGVFAGAIVFRDHHIKTRESREPIHKQRIEEQVLPPRIITSRAMHSRLFPKRRAFSYPYLYVGVPIGIEGRVSNFLSIDSQYPAWFNVDSADYLEHGHAHLTLGEKLKRYLHSQGVSDQDYAFAYLVTAPRFLGYSFNQMSFWYLYDSNIKLQYVILEVNNMFEERRMYLLRADNANADLGLDSGEQRNDVMRTGSRLVFTDSWQKDTLTPPLNRRKGSYSLCAADPLVAYEETGDVRVDNVIIHRSSNAHAEIVAQIWLEGAPKDPADISRLETAEFIITWYCVGLATFPRICWEASKLVFQRKLHICYTPEVDATDIDRPYSEDEWLLEPFFQAFLNNAVSESSQSLRVIYKPAHNDIMEDVMKSPTFAHEEGHTLTIKVVCPAFYRRFVHYVRTKEAFDYECLIASQKNRTVIIDPPGLLSVLLDDIQVRQQKTAEQHVKQSTFEKIRWAILGRLRCPPTESSYQDHSSQLAHSVRHFLASGISELDRFVQAQCTDSDIYRRIVCKLFLAKRLGLGATGVLVAVDWIVRATTILASMLYSSNSTRVIDVLRPRQYEFDDIGTVATMLLLANSIHILSLVKG